MGMSRDFLADAASRTIRSTSSVHSSRFPILCSGATVLTRLTRRWCERPKFTVSA